MAASMTAVSIAAPKVTGVSLRQFSNLKAVSLPAARPSHGSVAVGGRGALQVRAARVGGVDIPNQKRIETALTYVFGIGPTTARAILSDTEIENKRTRELTEEELVILRQEVDKYQVEGDLRRFNALSIKRLMERALNRRRSPSTWYLSTS
mmetsp:Transcript_19503/g.37358  ORF Transcript_19503/g.37358 Transcript_19503/m.37358 type:complete len:151 (-) Transcript_19503:395-847(-)